MRLIVVRHFKTCSNAADRILGWGDSPPSEDWEKDLIFVDKTLRRQGIEIDAIYSSDLERAKRTAQYYAQSRSGATFRHSGQLNEVNYGKLYHKSKNWVSANIRQYKTDPNFVFPEGESFNQMRARSVKFVLGLACKQQAQTILLVIHAGVIRGLICHFLDLDYSSNLKRKISHQYIGDFQIEGSRCIQYEELGTPSGFINQEIIIPPGVMRMDSNGTELT